MELLTESSLAGLNPTSKRRGALYQMLYKREFIMKKNEHLINAVGAKVHLQDNFTEVQIEQLLEDITEAPSGYPLLFANEYQGSIYIENLTGVVLTVLPKKITKAESEHFRNEMLETFYLDYSNNFLSINRMAEYYKMEVEEVENRINLGRELNQKRGA